MALIDCPKCGKKVSDLADKCIHCNADISTGLLENTDKSAPNPISDEFRLKSLDDIKQKNSALIDCPKCGKKYTDKATKCPHCNPNNSNNSNEGGIAFSPSIRAGFYLKCVAKDAKWYALTIFTIGLIFEFYRAFFEKKIMNSDSEIKSYENFEKHYDSFMNVSSITQIFASIATLFFFYSIFTKIGYAGDILHKQKFGNGKLEYNGYWFYIVLFVLFVFALVFMSRFNLTNLNN
jgi:hypothetical protein